MSDIFAYLSGISQQPQVQCSTSDQAHALAVIANRFGLDFLVRFIKRNFTETLSVPYEYIVDMNLVKSISQREITSEGFPQQIGAAYALANKFGLYDIADYFRALHI